MSNPFTSGVFVKVWSEHFNQSKPILTIEGIKGLGFVKKDRFPFLYNAGKNLTKGLEYTIDAHKLKHLKHNIICIQDVVSSADNSDGSNDLALKILKTKLYPGFAIELERFDSIEHYLNTHFKKPSRYKIKKHKKRLETCFDISYKTYWGELNEGTYLELFQSFRMLLEKRYKAKKVYNNNLDKKEWDFYLKVYYPLILEKKAALFVTYENSNPIAITLLTIKEHTAIHTLTVFDIDYSKFQLGSSSNLQLIDWCLQNNFKILDFSKGHFDYKVRWSTKKYDFEYHVLYNPKSIVSSLLAYAKFSKEHLKMILRKRKVNGHVHRLTYFFRNFKPLGQSFTTNSYTLKDNLDTNEKLGWEKVAIESIDPIRRKGVFDFLYLSQEPLHDILIFESHSEGTLRIRGQEMEKFLVKNRDNR
ncbi:MAG: GNAT family N-acetyltransferase [Allomuricauda sp.]|nr:MAG: GNAT family N-acetyltransferase [Allomuricauda sp.]